MSNKYHKTGQYRNAVKHVYAKLTYGGMDNEGNILQIPMNNSTVEYVGTIKLHGTNASIIIDTDNSIGFHSKNRLLGSLDKGGQILDGSQSDNSGFFSEMSLRSNWSEINNFILRIKEQAKIITGKCDEDIKISGEWAGAGIQSGVGISKLEYKCLFVFGIKIGGRWYRDTDFINSFSTESKILMPISKFGVYGVNVDLNFPEKASAILADLTYEVENECPVARYLGVDGPVVGEGLVWRPCDKDLDSDTDTWFKTKGQKHSVSKVKKVASVNPEKLESIEKFVEYTVTKNRLCQGLENVELDIKNTGAYIGWVNRDIYEEELDTLEASGLTMKDVGGHISSKAREYFINLLN